MGQRSESKPAMPSPSHRRPLWAVQLLLLLSALATPRLAAATGASSSSLSWSRLDGAEGCIGTRQLARAVETMLGRQVFVSAARAEVSVEGRVSRRDGTWVAAITVADEDGRALGERTLRSGDSSCHDLDEPVVLAIALMIDPDATLEPGISAPSVSQPTLPAPAAPAVTPAEVSAEVRVEERLVFMPAVAPAADRPSDDDDIWQLGVRAGPSAAVGLLPEVGFGVNAAVVIEPPWLFAVEASGTLYLPRAATLEGHSADFALAYVGLAPCPLRQRFAALSLSLCAEVQLGRLWADGEDALGPWQQHQLVVNLAPRARAEYRIVGPLELGLGLGAAFPLLRDSFTLNLDDGGRGELFRLPPVAAQTDLAVGLQFP